MDLATARAFGVTTLEGLVPFQRRVNRWLKHRVDVLEMNRRFAPVASGNFVCFGTGWVIGDPLQPFGVASYMTAREYFGGSPVP